MIEKTDGEVFVSRQSDLCPPRIKYLKYRPLFIHRIGVLAIMLPAKGKVKIGEMKIFFCYITHSF